MKKFKIILKAPVTTNVERKLGPRVIKSRIPNELCLTHYAESAAVLLGTMPALQWQNVEGITELYTDVVIEEVA